MAETFTAVLRIVITNKDEKRPPGLRQSVGALYNQLTNHDRLFVIPLCKTAVSTLLPAPTRGSGAASTIKQGVTMIDELFRSGTLNLVYTAVILISFVFAAMTLIGAEVGDAIDFDVDADADGDLGFVSLSPFALAMFGAAFGLTGLVTRIWLEMAAIPSVLWSSLFGVVVGAVAQALFIYVLSPSKSSHFSLSDDAVGREAEVVITIPGSGQGRIAYDNVSGRVALGARSLTGRQIKSGEFVKIERITGRVAFVSPIEKE